MAINLEEQPTPFLAESFIDGEQFPIDPELHQTLSKAITTVVSAMEIEELFQVFAHSFLNLEEDILKLSLEYAYIERDDREHSDNFFNKVRRRLNVRIITILTAFQSYDDQTNRILIHASHLPKVQQANKAARASAFDDNFSYRVCTALRNYAQHRDLPLGGFDIGARADFSCDKHGKVRKDSFRYDVSPWLNVTKLKGSSQTKRNLKNELEQIYHKYIDLKWLLRSFVSAVYHRHETLRQHLKAEVESAQLDISTAYESISLKKGSEVRLLDLHGGDQKHPMRKDLGTKVLREFKTLTSLRSAARNYVSSKIELEAKAYSGQ
ncbi:hypothetical protein MACH17_10480 [Phaeobacter inhibens]|uniref:hypothetical protein n=1 Tax=Phaeobacter inhibens TaxID=221822 RepID=UPI002760EA27|nr:hypothetical protein [Phaeobacter inhibens]GLO69531.1 hypothetical protein MACH17_10480 [Phaeobacter inhibens]